MAYKIMKNLIQNGTRTKEELLNMADVYYAAGRMTDAEYSKIIAQINGINSTVEAIRVDGET